MSETTFLELPSIDPFGCEGFEMNWIVNNDNICDVTPREGFVNQFGLVSKEAKMGYPVFNRKDRIESPLLLKDGAWQKISAENAIDCIQNAVAKTKSDENAVFASSLLTNELLYSIQKWTRAALKTNAIHSFQYLEVGTGYNLNKNDILPLHEFVLAEKVYVVGTELNAEHSLIDAILQKMRTIQHTPATYITNRHLSPYLAFTDDAIMVKNYWAFFRAVNYYLLHTHQAHGIFVNGLAANFESYQQKLLAENLDKLIQMAGVSIDEIAKFVEDILHTEKCAFVISEKSTDVTIFLELKNLMLLIEKQAKPSSGILSLRKTCNSQGIYDMGIIPELGAGNRAFTKEYVKLLKQEWGCSDISARKVNVAKQLRNNAFKNIFIFGENPFQTNPKYSTAIKNADFVVVQSPFLNETTELASLILPMNFPFEIGGSFTSAFKVFQPFEANRKAPFEWNDYHFFSQLNVVNGLTELKVPNEIFLETISLFSPSCCGGTRHKFE